MKRIAVIVLLIVLAGCASDQHTVNTVPDSSAAGAGGTMPELQPDKPEPESALVVVPLSREAAGLSTLNLVEWGDFRLHPTAVEMLELSAECGTLRSGPPGSNEDWKDQLYAAGFLYSPSVYSGVAILEHMPEPFLGELRIGDRQRLVRDLLGAASLQNGDTWYYKTQQYYVAIQFDGDRIHRVFVEESPPPLTDLLLLKELLECALQQEDADLSPFFTGRSVGWGWQMGGRTVYTHHNGLALPILSSQLSVYNNFEGELYQLSGSDGISPVFIDEDYYIRQLQGFQTEIGTIFGEIEPASDKGLSWDGRYRLFSRLLPFRMYVVDVQNLQRPMCHVDYYRGAEAFYDWYPDSYLVQFEGLSFGSSYFQVTEHGLIPIQQAP